MTTLFGKVTCGQCGQVNTDPQMMNMDDEGTETLIYCEHCKKWVKWC
jgi:NAD-dependent SIR2 family protein deacetylase